MRPDEFCHSKIETVGHCGGAVSQEMRRAAACAWWLMTVVSVGFAVASAAHYWTLDPERFFPEQRTVYLQNLFWVCGHVVLSPMALMLGPFLFHPRLRSRFPRVHAGCGFIYFAAVLGGAIAGMALSFRSYGGWTAQTGFAVLAVLWIATAAAAFHHLGRRSIDAHRRWAMRNFSLTFAAATLRLWIPLFMSVLEQDFRAAYQVAAWISWVPNLIVAELLIRAARVTR